MKKFAKYMPMGGFPSKVGHAFQASISEDKRGNVKFFVEMAPQVKEKPPSGSKESPFDWKLKKFISLDSEEMGKLMACFRGRLKNVEIVHKFPMDAPPAEQKLTGLNISQSKFKEEINWRIALMQKVGNEKPETYNLFLSAGEAEVLMVFLQKGIALSYEL